VTQGAVSKISDLINEFSKCKEQLLTLNMINTGIYFPNVSESLPNNFVSGACLNM
jgi:hypothetical protein